MADTTQPPSTGTKTEKKSTGRGVINATGAALLGSALGIIGSIVVATMSANSTEKDHAADRAQALEKDTRDRADARSKDRRETVRGAYVAALTAALVCDSEAQRFEHPPDPAVSHNNEPIKRGVPDDVLARLELDGSTPAVKMFKDALNVFGALQRIPPNRLSTEGLHKATFEHFRELISAFGDIVRKEIQADRF